MIKNSGFALLLLLCLVASFATAEPVCPADFSLLKVTGSANTAQRSLEVATPPITIIRQSSGTVQFVVRNSTEHGIGDDIFVQSQKDVYGSERCSMYSDLGAIDVAESSTEIITAHCYNIPAGGSMTLVRVYVRSFSEVLGSAIIPDCCPDPSFDLSFSTVEYIYSISCDPTCDDPDTYVEPVPPTDAPTDAPTTSPSGAPSSPPTVDPVPRRSLQEEIIKDMMPESSSNCPGEPMTSSFTYESSMAESQWYAPFADFEEDLFLAKMEHTDNNFNRSWTIRLGQAGNIYSYVGPMGETVPPQEHANAPWVDEVWQAVQPLGPNGDNDRDPATDKYFIHEAGTYTKDSPYTNKPFYSPTLGSYCNDDEGECGFVSWGQQAHVPTQWTSPLLYLNRYVNCGNGVFEYTTFRHNIAGNPDTFGYMNVPWGGARNSVLNDIAIANKATGQIEPLYPLPLWGEGKSSKLRDTMGFTVFAENLPKATNPLHDTPYTLPAGLNFVRGTGACTCERNCNTEGDRYVCSLTNDQPTDFDIKWAPNGAYPGVQVRFETPQTIAEGATLVVGVRHWEGNGRRKVFFYWDPSQEWNLADLRRWLPAGEAISVYHYYPPTGDKLPQDNLAMAHVHGQFGTGGSYPRIRYGYGGRDYNVYTVNDTPRIPSGSSYYYRQYFMMDSFTEMLAKGTTWSPEAAKATKGLGSISGRTVKLYKNPDNVHFGFTVDTNACRPSGAVEVCSGFTTPQTNTKPIFEIYCGSNYAVTDNLYHFSPPASSSDPTIRSYVCDGMADDVRPVWTLLGYFGATDCAAIGTAFQFDPDYC